MTKVSNNDSSMRIKQYINPSSKILLFWNGPFAGAMSRYHVAFWTGMVKVCAWSSQKNSLSECKAAAALYKGKRPGHGYFFGGNGKQGFVFTGLGQEQMVTQGIFIFFVRKNVADYAVFGKIDV